jgi:hypothetical protein
MTKKKDTKKKKEELAAIADVFGNACKSEPRDKKGKKKKKEREVIKLPKPFDLLVAGSILQSALRKLKAKDEYAKLKAKVFDIYFQKWTKNGDIDPSVVGECDRATALFTLRKMNSMTEETAMLLKKNKVPFNENDIILDGLVLNPDVMFDQDLLGALAIAVKKIKAFKNVELFLPQDAITTYTITEETFKRASKIKNIKEREKVLTALTTMSMSQPKIDEEGASSTSAQTHALKLLSKKGIFQVTKDDEEDEYE